MWINFLNLNGGNIDDFLKGDEPRESCHILCEPESLMLRVTEFRNIQCWIVSVVTAAGPDPKLHFTDEAKARECYAYLASLIPGKDANFYIEVDALAQGGL
jgi:hypothetical protein